MSEQETTVPGPDVAADGMAAGVVGDGGAVEVDLDGEASPIAMTGAGPAAGSLAGEAAAGAAAEEEPAKEESAGDVADGAAEAGLGEKPAPVEVEDLERAGDVAADYIEGLLDIADLDGDIDMDVEGDRALVSVVGATLDELVGERGAVLDALQELTRLAVQRQTGLRTRLTVDIGGFRAKRRAELAERGREAADEVTRTGEPKRLAPMSAFDRKVVHDAVAAAGLHSESEGEEPARRVVVYPAGYDRS